jgi:uncharacterized membrane protein YjjP (DUF1212 family)
MINQTRICAIASVCAILVAPVIILLGAFSPSSLLMGLALLIIGGLGLFGAMRELNR